MALASLPRVVASGVKFLLKGREKSFVVNRIEARELARGQFAEALREAFPGKTDAEVARLASPVLKRSERQIQNWLAGSNSALIEDVYTVVAILGIFKAMEIMTRDQTRNTILEQIGQR